ncbi:MAG: hypothetical protein N2423_00425 [Novosphingobium sp.]|nr:hypothetical protein [Novosphingobium sp.]
MIAMTATGDFASLAARLTARAEEIARERARQALLERRHDALRWREPDYLWPRFAKG